MAERALAHIEKIEWIKPIEGADNIELIGVLGWVCIAKKGEFQVGDLCVYFEIDSKLPEAEWSEFMRAKHFKIKTMKLGKFNVISQGLALPFKSFEWDEPEDESVTSVWHNDTLLTKLNELEIGSDVTKLLRVKYSCEEDNIRKANTSSIKYENMAKRNKNIFKKPIVKKIMKYPLGREVMFFLFGKKEDDLSFPSWIVKTDETRIENAPFYLESEEEWVKTEKLDGTSCTYAIEKKRNWYGKKLFEFYVCSRNIRQSSRNQKTYFDSNIYWNLAERYDIQKKLTEYLLKENLTRVVLQGEGVGNVQQNPYKLSEDDFFAFNLVKDGVRTSTVELKKFCDKYDLKTIPIIDTNYRLPKTMEEMKLEADGYSALNPKVKREGFVYRSQDGQRSFKNVSREYLLKHNG